MLITQEKVKKIRNAILLCIGLYIMLGSALYLFQERMLFLPTSLDEQYTFEFDRSFQELNYTPEAGVTINALHFKVEDPQGVIFYSHGNAGDLSRWGHIASQLCSYGYDVLVWDYRTYGKSKGKLSEEAIYRDAQYIYNEIKMDFHPDSIVLYGRSLGTGVASYLASTNKSRMLILETPYYSIVDVASYRFPYFPVEKLLSYRFPNYEFLPEVDVPVTIIHGTDDTVVPIKSAQKLEQLNIKDLNFITIQNGGHNNLSDFEGYHKAIANCLK